MFTFAYLRHKPYVVQLCVTKEFLFSVCRKERLPGRPRPRRCSQYPAQVRIDLKSLRINIVLPVYFFQVL